MDSAPLGTGSVRRVLSEGGGDEGGYDASPALAAMGQGIAHEMHLAALPCAGQNLGDGGLDALVRVADYQLPSAQAAAGQFA